MRNRLTVLEEAGRNKQSHLLLKCRCDCGNITLQINTGSQNLVVIVI